MIIEIDDGEFVYGLQTESINYYVRQPKRDNYYGGPRIEVHFNGGEVLVLPYETGLRFTKQYKELESK